MMSIVMDCVVGAVFTWAVAPETDVPFPIIHGIRALSVVVRVSGDVKTKVRVGAKPVKPWLPVWPTKPVWPTSPVCP